VQSQTSAPLPILSAAMGGRESRECGKQKSCLTGEQAAVPHAALGHWPKHVGRCRAKALQSSAVVVFSRREHSLKHPLDARGSFGKRTKQEKANFVKSMIHKWATSLLALVLFAGLSTVSLRAGNLLLDAGFEQQTPATQGGWYPFYGAWFSSDYARSGNWSMFVPTDPGVGGSFEQYPAAPGSQWRLTGYGMTPTTLEGSPAFGVIQISFFDINGNDLGTVETTGTYPPAKLSNSVDWSTPVNAWQFLDTETATAPEGTSYIQAFTIYVDFSGFYQGVYFDDLNLEILGVNHGQYVSSIAQNAGALKRAGLVTEVQAVAMVEAAAKSAGGKE